jgi:hypothetical protein
MSREGSFSVDLVNESVAVFLAHVIPQAHIEDAKSPLGKAHLSVMASLKKRYACPLDCFSQSTGKLLNSDLRGYLVGLSIQAEGESGPRLMLACGRDERMIPKRKNAEPP